MVLLGDKEEEKVLEKLSKVDKSFYHKASRSTSYPYLRARARRGRGVRCFHCQAEGHYARNCMQRPGRGRTTDRPEASTR